MTDLNCHVISPDGILLKQTLQIIVSLPPFSNKVIVKLKNVDPSTPTVRTFHEIIEAAALSSLLVGLILAFAYCWQMALVMLCAFVCYEQGDEEEK